MTSGLPTPRPVTAPAGERPPTRPREKAEPRTPGQRKLSWGALLWGQATQVMTATSRGATESSGYRETLHPNYTSAFEEAGHWEAAWTRMHLCSPPWWPGGAPKVTPLARQASELRRNGQR